ncbi:tetratricopeptide repeat protein [Mucilaginibacter myungsuensis]|uniref:Tetratricopeptide repeat protein n=1 Tax=Mucilaginibacter myungsuensis TaxID=649104 RepID=A0A929L414_9SPHI|nr:tetratricopeptide repeat protein [Mucilaginibacter myungsuensis]MBE9664079.1 tetratricopeptide repeat protein [Mucilaginibacter myungsuensis]MDN3601258.1 tetratricopeptide repeat protein [Mucilaginibacter myungsuensis]
MKKTQIALIAVIAVIVGYLFLQPVKGLVKPKEEKSNGMVAGAKPAEAAANVSVEMISAAAKTAIGADLSAKIVDLEGQLKAATGTEKTKLQQELAKQWDDVAQPAPAAFYYMALAREGNRFDNWLKAGTRFNEAYRATQDSSIQGAMVLNAVEALQAATKLQPSNLDAKAGLGVAYVNGGSANPMDGISLLLGVVKEDPNNRVANFNLGMFSLKSGQFDKALPRFNKVIEQDPSALEPYFYLAEAHKQLGQKKEAIAAYEKCKELMRNRPDFVERIDGFIKELKN